MFCLFSLRMNFKGKQIKIEFNFKEISRENTKQRGKIKIEGKGRERERVIGI
jgi:hypothetical protein